MKKLIVANWKELPETWGQGEELLAHVDDCLSDTHEISLVICPPFKYLEEVAKILHTGHLEHMAELGAQDLHEELHCARYVIIGHSSRRAAGESDEVVNEKLKLALAKELVPIVCIEDAKQAQATFASISTDDVSRCLVAYEPVWAISTNPGGHPDTPENAVEAISKIRSVLEPISSNLEPRFLYGGSITDANAEAFLSRPEFSGVLVGGASVRIEEFCRILSIAAQLP